MVRHTRSPNGLEKYAMKKKILGLTVTLGGLFVTGAAAATNVAACGLCCCPFCK
jgi:hypothetical protein